MRWRNAVLLAAPWHNTMSIVSFELDKLFTVLEPKLVVDVAGTFNFPDEIKFVQRWFLSVKLHFVVVMKGRLVTDPLP
jgi:hypothetical protein